MKKPNSDYWANRKAQFMVKQMASAEDTAVMMYRGYDIAKQRLEVEADKIFHRFQKEYGLSEHEARELLKRAGTDVDAVMRDLANMNINADKLAEVNSAAYAHRIEALKRSSGEIDQLVQALAKRDTGLVTDHLKQSAKDAYLHSIYMTQQQAGIAFNFQEYDATVIEELLKVNWTKKHFSQAIWDNSQNLGTALKEEFMVNYLTGGSTDDMARRLAERMHVNYFNARRLVRTESTFVEAEMEARGYEACHIDEYEYVSVLDNRTSSLCRKHDGKIYKVKDRQPGVNYPPLHVFCRATTIAHIPDDYAEEFEDAHPLERMSFEKWKELVSDDSSEISKKEQWLLRNKDKEKRKPISKVRQRKLTEAFIQRGGHIWQDEEATRYLDSRNAAAMCLNGKEIVLRAKPTVSEVLEELFHAEQWEDSRMSDNDIIKIKCEIEAQHYLLSVEKLYNIPRNEIEQTKLNLLYWERELKKYDN